MPRLLVLTSSFPTSPDDYRGGFVLEWCEEMAVRGWPCTIVAPESATGGLAAPRAGCRVEPLRYWWPRERQALFGGHGVMTNLARRPTLAVQALGFVTAALRHSVDLAAYDAVVSHWLLPMGLWGAVLHEQLEIPHLAICHSSDLALLERVPASRTIARAIARHSARVVFVSSTHEERFRRLHGLPILTTGVQPMGVHYTPTPAVRARSASSRPARVGFLGRLVPLKGVATLIEALRGLADVELVVGGDGPERAQLEGLARRVGLRARFDGRISSIERSHWLRQLDALVIPSQPGRLGLVEGAPRVALEAMSCGIPLVATAVGGIPELVGETAALVPPGDPSALRATLASLLSDAERRDRLASKAQRRVERLYRWEVAASRFVGWLDEAVSGREKNRNNRAGDVV